MIPWTLAFFCCFALLVQSASVPPANEIIAESPVALAAEPAESSIIISALRRKRHGEIYDTTFLPGNHVILRVRSFGQTCRMTCGPTCVAALLYFFGNRVSTMNSPGDISGNEFIDSLILAMETEPNDQFFGGTSAGRLVSELNRRIINNNLNSLRQYSLRYVDPHRQAEFTRDVYNSLLNGSPVILAFDGGYTPFEQPRRHFIVIDGVRITEQFAEFFVMDPAGGERRTFTDHALTSLVRNVGFLIYHDPRSLNLHRERCEKSTLAGGSAGILAGSISGATVGSMVPGIGTLVGGFIGAGLGYFAGSGVGHAAC